MMESVDVVGGVERVDPGWRRAAVGLVPIANLVLRREKTTRRLDGLTVLRRMFLAFVEALVFVGVVVALVDSQSPTKATNSTIAVVVIVAVGVVGQVLARVFSRPLKTANNAELAGSYRSRFLSRVAFSESAAIAGFIGFLVVGDPVLYPLGAIFSIAGYVWLAPTAAALARDQRIIAEQGSRLSLCDALMGPATPM